MAKEQGSKVSFHCGRKVSQAHNVRDFNVNKWNKDGHIDYTRSYMNETIIDYLAPEKWNEWCEEEFGKAIDEFNEKNKTRNPDRVINKDAKYKEFRKSVQESVIQVGNERFNPLSNEEHLAFLHSVIEHWQKDNPTLKVVGAYIHMDETTPHLHLDWLPVAHSTRGLSVKVSMDGALKDMGIGRAKNQKYEESPYRRFLVQERAKLEDIGREYTEIIEAEHGKIKTHTEYYEHQGKEKIKKIKQEQKVAEQEKELAEQKAAQMQELAEIEEGRLKTLTRKSEEQEEKVETLTQEVEHLSDLEEDLGEKVENLQEQHITLSKKVDEKKADVKFFETLKEIQNVAGTPIVPEILAVEQEKKRFGKTTPANITITKKYYDELVGLATANKTAQDLNRQTIAAAGKIDAAATTLTRSTENSIEVAIDSRVQRAERRAERAESENKSLREEVKELREWKEETKDYPELKERVSVLEELVDALKTIAKSLVKFFKGELLRDGRDAYEGYTEDEGQYLGKTEQRLFRGIEKSLNQEQHHHFGR